MTSVVARVFNDEVDAASTGRTYAGETAADRLARRRRQLLDAGLQVFGTTGYRQATVRELCRAAKVTDRYFYEQFTSTEDLLAAVYDECLDRLQAAAVAGVEAAGAGGPGAHPDVRAMARGGLDGFLGVVHHDPRLARLVWFEVLGVSPRVEALYLGRMRAFGDLLVGLLGVPLAPLDDDDVAVRTLADAAVGGISHCVMAWAAGGFTAPRETLVEALAVFLEASAAPLRQT